MPVARLCDLVDIDRGGIGLASNLAEIDHLNYGVSPRSVTDPLVHGKPLRKARILFVDETSPDRSASAATLEHQGYRVQIAAGGPEAFEALQQAPFDLVLADNGMPDGEAIALLELIHAQQPRLPVIILSAVQDIDVAIDFMRRGAYDYLLKPLEDEKLLGAVERALDHRSAIEESQNYRQNLEHVVQARTDMLRRALEQLEHSYDVTLEALGDALDLKDSETEGHSKRVTAYTIALARAMGLKPAEIKIIARGAFLHDIGKMAIPDEILRKPGKLTPEEKAVMREHCARGYHILRKIPFLAGAAEIVFSHQEHYLGGGYPKGLRGDEIPIGARIFAVADTLDAITSDRPYRKATSFNDAREEIRRCSGTQFDPAVVEVFLTISSDLWKELRAEIDGQNLRLNHFDITRTPEPPTR